ncbi:hypothetical protein GCM10010196_30680 [Agromyces mediolanus]|uniref:Uncharacterized protein n=1 Tax=Agromyces mediolanus TaxID=41986 RepID=A0A918CNM8_AGRME|nr:hypothetical protein GCM10010196_30680 [Agromyces mediolanus]
MRGVGVIVTRGKLRSFIDERLVVERAAVERDSEVPAAVLGEGTLLGTQERLVELLTVPGADHLDFRLTVAEQPGNGSEERLDGARRSLPHEEITG